MSTDEVTVLSVLNDEGWCSVIAKGTKTVMKFDPVLLQDCGFAISKTIKPASDDRVLMVKLEPGETILTDKTNNPLSGTVEWGTNNTKLLLDYYSEYLKDVGPMKKFKNKKAMWIQISNHILNHLQIHCTPAQCETRYKTVLKRKSISVNKNRRTGESPEPIELEAEISKIKTLDDSVEPEVFWGVGTYKRKDTHSDDENHSSSSTASMQSTKKKTKDSLATVLYKIHKEKEESRQKRREEKIALIKELFKK